MNPLQASGHTQRSPKCGMHGFALKFRHALLLGAFLLGSPLLSTFVASAGAQSSGGPYRIAAGAIAGGGSTSSGGRFQLRSTSGQAQTATLSASGYRFHDGFWAPVSDVIFSSGFDR